MVKDAVLRRSISEVAGTKDDFERLSDRFFRNVDEWFLRQHGIRHCRTTLWRIWKD
jgi:hypothetical protein